jgi:hypothetical protein
VGFLPRRREPGGRAGFQLEQQEDELPKITESKALLQTQRSELQDALRALIGQLSLEQAFEDEPGEGA